MDRIGLSELEKELLRASAEKEFNIQVSKFEQGDELYYAAKRLEELGLADPLFGLNSEVPYIRVSSKGVVYLKENPELKNPLSQDEKEGSKVMIDNLNKELIELQIKSLKYQEEIKNQNSIIRWWQMATILIPITTIAIQLFIFIFK